ncbi:MAG: XdhC family protein [Humidesulfovibrio sp.]|nr:XdhC family protein [Humidesulfovibrio sp.]
MNDILEPLIALLEQGRPVVRATILTHEGSTPRSAGSRMLLCADSDGNTRIAAGTVGGGLVEARVMTRALQVLADGQRAVESFDLTGELAAGADMICGGRLRVFLERLEPTALELFRPLSAGLERGQGGLLLTPLGGGEGQASLLLSGGRALGEGLPPALEQAARDQGQAINAPVLLSFGGADYVLEPWTAANPLAILGAGHVSRSTAQVAALAGFQVLVLDDRPDFANAERFPGARTRVLPDFADALKDVPCGPGCFLVIVTRGHVHDAEVLAQALRTKADYIGMIGSRRKRDAVYDRLRGQGFTETDLARVRCPIGLDIGAETPEEIAVSIAAELIQVRAQLGQAHQEAHSAH